MKIIQIGQPWSGSEAFCDGALVYVIEEQSDYLALPASIKAHLDLRPAAAAAAAAAEAQHAKDLADAEAAKQYAKLRNLIALSPAQVQTWVAGNVTNLAQAQDAIATLSVAVSVLARRI